LLHCGRARSTLQCARQRAAGGGGEAFTFDENRSGPRRRSSCPIAGEDGAHEGACPESPPAAPAPASPPPASPPLASPSSSSCATPYAGRWLARHWEPYKPSPHGTESRASFYPCTALRAGAAADFDLHVAREPVPCKPLHCLDGCPWKCAAGWAVQTPDMRARPSALAQLQARMRLVGRCLVGLRRRRRSADASRRR
jgi:hypothetical protein